MSSTDICYAAASYAVPDTNLRYSPILYSLSYYAMSSNYTMAFWVKPVGPQSKVGHLPTRLLCDVRTDAGYVVISLRACYAVSGTDTAYRWRVWIASTRASTGTALSAYAAAMRCPVLI
eukprot:1372238-Rhodomonas_salina.5